MVGIDLVLVSRIEKEIENDKFIDKILNGLEKEYILKNKKSSIKVEAQSVAGFFAVKEAVLKAFGVGITNGYGFKDITIDHDKSGAPIVLLSDKLKDLLNKKSKSVVEVSISHDGDYATAVAILC